jgi:hypothetical protein
VSARRGCRPGSASDDLARAGCGSGLVWPCGRSARPVRARLTSLARSTIRSPHVQPRRDVRKASFARGSDDSETWIEQAPGHLRPCSASLLTGRGPLGLRLGLCPHPWRVAAHFVTQPAAGKHLMCRYFLQWRDPDSTGDTTIFRHRGRAPEGVRLQGICTQRWAPDWRGFPWFRLDLGHEGGARGLTPCREMAGRPPGCDPPAPPRDLARKTIDLQEVPGGVNRIAGCR